MILACLAASLASCVNDGLGEPRPEGGVKGIATLAEQAASIQATVAEINSVQALLENEDPALEAAISSLESHAASVRTSQDWASGTLATMAQQKKLAAAAGALKAKTDDAAVLSGLKSIEDGAKAWLGKHMTAYYPAAAALAEAEARLAAYGKTLSMWKIQVEGIASDVEAGLKEGIDPKETDAMLASLASVAEASEDLQARLAASVSDVEEGYQKAIATAADDPESFDASALTSLNKAAAADLQDTGVTLQDLIDRVAACESEVAALKDRVSALEGEMGNWEDLLDMIQSVTFMSDFSEEKVVAYYDLNTESEERTEEGYMLRTKTESLELKYVVRPASAAAALTEETLWNDGLKVFGHYAESLTKAAPEMEYEITDVTADESGIVTLTVKNPLSDDFYFKKTGAKLALSITAGKTDLTSKFVEIVPKDASRTVYAESLSLSFHSLDLNKVVDINNVNKFTVEKGKRVTLIAKVKPEGAVQTINWTSGTPEVAEVSEDGTLAALQVGDAIITATSDAIDEWGRTLTATFSVTVSPNIKIFGPHYVEKGHSINLRLESPYYIDPEKISWTVPTDDFAHLYLTLEQKYADGVNQAIVTSQGLVYVDKYKDIKLECTIEGEGTFEHVIQSVAVQPKKIVVDGLGDDENTVTMKFGANRSFSGTIAPDDVEASRFVIKGMAGGAGIETNMNSAYAVAKTMTDGASSGTVTLVAEPVGNNYYYYGEGSALADMQKLTRTINIVVEPYYVTSFSIPSSKEMTVGTPVTLLPDFTSDGDNGQDPSYTGLIWTSSDEKYVTVENGVLTAHEITDEPIIITAAIANPDIAIRPGTNVPTVAMCQVTVSEAASGDPVVGDFYFADGTWAPELPDDYDESKANNPVIGVVYALGADASVLDPIMQRDYPDGFTHGLVVGLSEYKSAFGNFRTDGFCSNSIYDATDGFGILGYGAVLSEDYPTGYGLTLAYANYREYIKSSSGYDKACILFDSEEGVAAKHNASVPIEDIEASSWFIPTKYDMNELYKYKSKINPALIAAGGTPIGDTMYWSCYLYNKKTNGISNYNDCFAYPIDMATGSWINNALNTTEYSVRVVLAF